MDGLVNTRPTSITFPSKPYQPVDNIKRPIKCNPGPSIFYMVTPLCHDTKNIISVTNKNKFISPSQAIITNNDHDRKEGTEIYRVSPSDETNPMGYNKNTLYYYDEGKNKAYKTDHTKKIRLITPEDKFLCHAQVIMTSRDQWRKLGLDISWIYTDYDFDIIGHHRKVLIID